MSHLERVPELIEAMLDPAFYPHSPRRVELRDTHISWVLLADERAYKVKKPISLPFLDYGTPARRREMCGEEVRLNRRLAPTIYLGVLGIAGNGDRYFLTEADDAAAIEYAVEMRRVEEGRSLGALLRSGRLQREQLAAVARRLARFHAEAGISPPQFRRLEAQIRPVEENLETLRDVGGGIIAPHRLEAAEHFTRAFLASHSEPLRRRAEGGLVREGHGDLKAEHVIVPSEGEIYVYDCVEFDPALRHIDVACDISFLVMDLTRLGARELASLLIADYRDASGDPGEDSIVSFFASYRAWVRAKIACLRAGAAQDAEHARCEAEARELFGLGHRFAWDARGPLVLILCGVAGTGKTTVARRLAELNGWPVVSSDSIRKSLAGLRPSERGRPEHYSPEFTQRTYRELGRAAREQLESRGGVIADATFHRRDERDAFRAGLDDLSARILFIECRAPPEVLEARIRARAAEPHRVSDADIRVVERQVAEREPLAEVPPRERLELDTEGPREQLLVEIEGFVDRAAWRLD